MKFSAIPTVIITSLVAFPAFSQVKMPSPSPSQTIRQELGLGSIEVTYSRPGAKGRKVFGDLVPNGKLWRTGANAATKLTFTEPVEIGGKRIDSGTYVLYSIPGDENWEIILNKGVNNWGIEGYQEKEDIIHIKALAAQTPSPVETFTIQFANVKTESCDLQLLWENKSVSISIETDVKQKLKLQLDAAMTSEKKPYWQATQYYYEYDKNLPKALEYANKAIETNLKAFWMYLYKARIQKEMGDNAGALASSKISLNLAREANNDDYVKMNERLQKELKN